MVEFSLDRAVRSESQTPIRLRVEEEIELKPTPINLKFLGLEDQWPTNLLGFGTAKTLGVKAK